LACSCCALSSSSSRAVTVAFSHIFSTTYCTFPRHSLYHSLFTTIVISKHELPLSIYFQRKPCDADPVFYDVIEAWGLTSP
jgi:hypothetical protein